MYRRAGVCGILSSQAPAIDTFSPFIFYTWSTHQLKSNELFRLFKHSYLFFKRACFTRAIFPNLNYSMHNNLTKIGCERRIFLVVGMNFNCVCNEVSRDPPISFVSVMLHVCWEGEPLSFIDWVPSGTSTFSLSSFSCLFVYWFVTVSRFV